MTDLVSIIIPYYNSEKTIQRCVNSVLAQTYSNTEIIIIDDGSTFDSVAHLKKFAQVSDRILLLMSETNNGAGFTRNRGIFTAGGRYIAFLDADDYWIDERKLEKQVDLMSREGTGFCFSSYYIDAGKALNLPPAPKVIHYRSLRHSNYIGCLTAIYDTHFYNKRYMPIIRKRQDWSLWLKLFSINDRVSYIEEPMAIYSKHNNGSLSSSGVLSLLYYHWYIYKKYLKLPVFISINLLTINLLKLVLKKWKLK